jgi:hypothetical protein
VRLARTIYSQESVIVAALGVQAHRLGHYTKRLPVSFIERAAGAKTIEQVKAAWYEDGGTRTTQHYHESRYHGLNVHSYFYRGTVEFRYFEATLHAGKVKAYVQLCLATMAHAVSSKTASARPVEFNAAQGRYQIRVFMKRIGLIGEEFKCARTHLMENVQNTINATVASARPRTGGAS